MEDLNYQFDMKRLKRLTYNDRIAEFEEFSGDHDMAVLLEYFYSSYWSSYEPNDYMFNMFIEEIENFYKYLVFTQSGNSTTEKAYAFTNENLSNLFESDKINVEGKRVLTVGSSGDQALNALYYGANEVDVADMNIMTKLFIDLKVAMIKNLSYEDFATYSEMFVTYLNTYYPKISHDLPKETQQFFDTIIIDGISGWFRNFLRETGLRGSANSKIFTDPEAYYKLQDKLLDGDFKLNFIVGDVRQFVNLTNGEYDLILLSNIYDYYDMFSSMGDMTYEFYCTIKDLYDNRLAENGMIEVTSRDYSYDGKYPKQMRNLYKFLESLKGEIVSVDKGGMDDGMLDAYPALFIAKTQQKRTREW